MTVKKETLKRLFLCFIHVRFMLNALVIKCNENSVYIILLDALNTLLCHTIFVRHILYCSNTLRIKILILFCVVENKKYYMPTYT